MKDIELSLPRAEYLHFVDKSIQYAFPDGNPYSLAAAFDMAIERTAECFSRVALAGYKKAGTPYLNHLHGDQSATFLYFLANSAFQLNEHALAEKCMLLNKARNGILVMYDTELPKHILLIHTVGTVLGKATYGDYFVATQNVTVGTHNDASPTFGRGVILYPRSLVAGNVRIGDFCRVAAGTSVLDGTHPRNSVIFGAFPDLTVRASKRQRIGDYFVLPPL